MIWNSVWGEGAIWFGSHSLSALAYITAVDILFDICMNPGPPVGSKNEFRGLVSTWVTTAFRIMV